MKRLLSLLLVAMPAASWAGSPLDMNSLPVFWDITGDKPMYHDAAFKAQEAFFVQTGITDSIGKLNEYVTNKATNKVTTFVDEDTPFNSKQLFFVLGATYAVGVKKHVTQSFKDPFFSSVKHTFDVTPTTQSTGISISF